MCGIAGLILPQGTSPNPILADNTLKVLHARGPDAQNYLIQENTLWCHTLLSIIQPQQGIQQPLRDPSGRYLLVFNGEILNYTELKSSLNQTWIPNHSDTSVLLAGLIQEGINFLPKIRGFFALGFYDFISQELILARDHVGIKPLYYYRLNNSLGFASEPGALFTLGLEKRININNLSWYISLGYLPSGINEWDQVNEVPVSGWIKHTPNQNIQSGIFHPEIPNVHNTSFKDHLITALNRNTIADTPGGILLSGGTDSTLLACAATKHFKSPLNAFSVGFPSFPTIDESERIKSLAHKLSMPLYIWNADKNSLADLALHWLDTTDELLADPAVILISGLCKHAHEQGIKWLWSGEGADEIWGGYQRYKAWKWVQNIPFTVPSLLNYNSTGVREFKGENNIRKLLRLIQLLQLPLSQRYSALVSTPEMNWCKPTLPPIHWNPWMPESSQLIDVLTADIRLQLPAQLLRKCDRASMSQGVEIRVPYLDEDWIAWAYTQPEKLRFGKPLLKKEILTYLPDWKAGPKRGLDTPLSLLFQSQKFQERWNYYLNSPSASEWIIPSVLKKLKKNALGNFGEMHWKIICFLAWIEKNKNN